MVFEQNPNGLFTIIIDVDFVCAHCSLIPLVTWEAPYNTPLFPYFLIGRENKGIRGGLLKGYFCY